MQKAADTGNRSSTTAAGAALVALLVVQIIIGYEWLTSGVTKVASGTFVSGLAADLKTNSDSAPAFYKSFLHGTIIPSARTFAVLIEVGEILVGVALIGAAIIWLARWARLSDRGRVAVLGVSILAALGGIFMAINFHLANGGNHPWLIPSDGFDETIDVDTVLVFMQGAYVVFCGYLLLGIRRAQQARAVSAKVQPDALPAAS